MADDMWAYQLLRAGHAPEFTTVAKPVPGPGEVLLKVAAAGLCHSDLTIGRIGAADFHLPLPLTLGHECAGHVAELGAGVTGVQPGDAVAVYGAWGCGRCKQCAIGHENYCVRGGNMYQPGEFVRPPGGGSPGALAEFMIVDDPRHLMAIGTLAPAVAAPLTDAGLTAFHAIERSRAQLTPQSVVLVIGVGGLGHLAVQILRATSPAVVIAVDQNPAVRALALASGAHVFADSESSARAAVAAHSDGAGADLVLDFVSATATVALAVGVAGRGAHVNTVGLGGGVVGVSFSGVPSGMSANVTRWGTIPDLQNVLALARRGVLTPEVQTFSRAEIPHAYDLLERGLIRGRAVIITD